MKTKGILIICFLLFLAREVSAQTMSEIFNRDVPITWLGLDFSEAKLLGDREKYGSSSDVKFMIKSWNDLVEREQDKYNVARATHKRKVEMHPEVATNHNEELDIPELLSNTSGDYLHLKQEDISSIISSYDFAGLTGIGLMFNVEGFNKFAQEAAIWVTFINLNTKEVMLTERFLAPPGGSGLRNYWARSILIVMEKMDKKQMEVWRTKFAK